MTVYCVMCQTYCNDNTLSHEGGKRHTRAVEQCIREGRPVPPFQYGVQSPNDQAMAVRSEEARLHRLAKAATPVRGPNRPPNDDPKQIYCPLCDVWSGSMTAHNVHIKGKRHKKAEEGSGAVLHNVQYTSEAQRQEQEAFKRQYIALVRDLYSYIRHIRGLVKAEHDFERDTVTKRVNETHPEQLVSEGYAFFNCTCDVSPSEAKKATDVMFTFPVTNFSSVPDSMVGCSVYVSPTDTRLVEIDNRQVTMLGECTAVMRDKIVIKNMLGKGKPWVYSHNGLYRIDVGVTTVPTERMLTTLSSLRRQHIERLRMLGIPDKIHSAEYFSDDDDDAIAIEGNVNPMGILEPFTPLAWCFFHDIQNSVNNARRMIYNSFQQYAEMHECVMLPSDTSSGMKALGNQPTTTDMTNATSEKHHQYDSFCVPNPVPAQQPRFSHNLNESQLEAIAKVVDTGAKLTLIQGPPGTGKTTTAVAIIAEWVRKHGRSNILATSHSNAGVDNLMTGLIKRGVRCLRVGKSSQPHLEEFSLESYVQTDTYSRDRNILQRKIDELKARMAAAERTGESINAIGKEWKEVSRRLKTTFSRSSCVRNAIREADVICATCISSGSNVLAGVSFPFVLIDEATQANEASSLVPICRGSVQVVMIGDQAQLPPTVLNYEAARRGLDVSLFDRMIGSGVEVHMLNTQYRMHPNISRFSNISFYNSNVHNGVTEAQRTCPAGTLPNDWPVSFTHVHGSESQQGTSRSNKAEAAAVVALLQFISGKSFKWGNVGVITPYSAQVRAIRGEIGRVLGQDVRNQIEVKSVDGFQGREKDVIILSTVRSGGGNISFVSEWRRINVSLTRARYGLFLVGNVPTLLTSPFWWSWLREHKAFGMNYNGTGSLTLIDPNLRTLIENTEKPQKQKYRDMRAFGDTLHGRDEIAADPSTDAQLPTAPGDWRGGARQAAGFAPHAAQGQAQGQGQGQGVWRQQGAAPYAGKGRGAPVGGKGYAQAPSQHHSHPSPPLPAKGGGGWGGPQVSVSGNADSSPYTSPPVQQPGSHGPPVAHQGGGSWTPPPAYAPPVPPVAQHQGTSDSDQPATKRRRY